MMSESGPMAPPPRARRGLFVVLVLGLVLLVAISCALWPKGPPQIQLSANLHDFGLIGRQDKVETTVTVRNVGGSPLEIRRVVTSCGCTKAQITSEMLSPGQEASLTIIFDAALHNSEGMSNSNSTEHVSHTVYVRSNDPAQPEVEVEIRAELPALKELP